MSESETLAAADHAREDVELIDAGSEEGHDQNQEEQTDEEEEEEIDIEEEDDYEPEPHEHAFQHEQDDQEYEPDFEHTYGHGYEQDYEQEYGQEYAQDYEGHYGQYELQYGHEYEQEYGEDEEEEHDGEEWEEGDVQGEYATNYEEYLYRFYAVHNPGHVSQIPAILRTYAGREDELIKQLHLKYLGEPDNQPAPVNAEQAETPNFQELIRRVYKERNPNKLAEIPAMLAKFAGRERPLYLRICEKYQVEPDPSVIQHVTESDARGSTGVEESSLKTQKPNASAPENFRPGISFSRARGLLPSFRFAPSAPVSDASLKEECNAAIDTVQSLHEALGTADRRLTAVEEERNIARQELAAVRACANQLQQAYEAQNVEIEQLRALLKSQEAAMQRSNEDSLCAREEAAELHKSVVMLEQSARLVEIETPDDDAAQRERGFAEHPQKLSNESASTDSNFIEAIERGVETHLT